MAKESKGLAFGAATSAATFLLVITVLYAAVFGSDYAAFDLWRQHLASWRSALGGNKIIHGREVKEPVQLLLRRLVRGNDRIQLDITGFSCHFDLHSELCLTKNPVRIHNGALKVYVESNQSQVNYSVRPYPRREDQTAMRAVTPVQILQGNTSPPACQFFHEVPAVVFSSGGFTGNLFHEFNEVIIPLFITCRHFHSNLQFIVSDYKPWWVSKYNRILSQLSRYEALNPATDGGVHCFPGAVIGLKYHDNLALNYSDIPGGYSMSDFKHFLRLTYGLKIRNVSEMEEPEPTLILVSRRKSRVFINEGNMVEMMEELGFKVITTPPYKMSNLDEFSSTVNSASVMVGAHGAGLTNEVFLPAGAVVVQVIPLGLDWPSNAYFGAPAGEMGLQYINYKIEAEESSLCEKYGPNHPVITDPMSVFVKGYYAARAVYVDGQNMTLNLARLKETLVEAKRRIRRSAS